jgi:hypothetical protein
MKGGPNRFFSELAYALAEQKSATRARLQRELEAGNWEIEHTGDRTIMFRIDGVTVMEATLYPGAHHARDRDDYQRPRR